MLEGFYFVKYTLNKAIIKSQMKEQEELSPELATQKVERDILRLREFGFDNDQILQQLDLKEFTEVDVEFYFRNALKRRQKNQLTIHDHRCLELERYDYYLRSLNRRIERGDDKAISAALKISIEKNKLLGLYTPVEVKLNLLVEERVNSEIEKFLILLETDPRMSEEILNLIREISAQFANDQVE